MNERNHPKQSVGAQCSVLSISRSSCHQAAQGETAVNPDLMLLIDKPFLGTPFYGVRQMTWHLRNGEPEPHPPPDAAHAPQADLPDARYQQARDGAQDLPPSGAGGLRAERPNKVGCAEITHLPMRRGFLYPVTILDRLKRKVLAWRIINTLTADFCVEAFNEAIHKFAPPTGTRRASRLISTTRARCASGRFRL